MRVAIHNGRTLVGPTVQSGSLASVASPGFRNLSLQGPELTLEWLTADVLTVLILELHASSPTAPADDLNLGTFVLAPFADFSADGSTAVLKAGLHR